MRVERTLSSERGVARLIVTLVVALAAAGPVHAQAAANDIAAVRALDSLWARNYAVNDTANALRLMAPDFLRSHADVPPEYTAIYVRGGPLGWRLEESHMASA